MASCKHCCCQRCIKIARMFIFRPTFLYHYDTQNRLFQQHQLKNVLFKPEACFKLMRLRVMLCCEILHASAFIAFPSFDTFSLQNCPRAPRNNNTPAVPREPSRSDLLAVRKTNRSRVNDSLRANRFARANHDLFFCFFRTSCNPVVRRTCGL